MKGTNAKLHISQVQFHKRGGDSSNKAGYLQTTRCNVMCISMRWLYLILFGIGSRACAQSNAISDEISVDWNKTLSISKSTPILQVVVNPMLRRGSPIHNGAFGAVKQLGADYVRYVHGDLGKGSAMGIYSVLLSVGAIGGSLMAGWLGKLFRFDGLLLGTVLLAVARPLLMARISQDAPVDAGETGR